MQELFASMQFTEVVKTTLGQLFLYLRRLSGLYVLSNTGFGICMSGAMRRVWLLIDKLEKNLSDNNC